MPSFPLRNLHTPEYLFTLLCTFSDFSPGMPTVL